VEARGIKSSISFCGSSGDKHGGNTGRATARGCGIAFARVSPPNSLLGRSHGLQCPLPPPTSVGASSGIFLLCGPEFRSGAPAYRASKLLVGRSRLPTPKPPADPRADGQTLLPSGLAVQKHDNYGATDGRLKNEE